MRSLRLARTRYATAIATVPARRAAAVAALLATAMLSFGCTAERATRGTLTIGTTLALHRFDPATCLAGSCATLVGPAVFEQLVALDEDGTPRPSLARSWTVSDDGLVYSFELTADAVFHDGSPVDAEAVAHSLRRLESLAGHGTGAFVLFDSSEPRRAGIGQVLVAAPDRVEVHLVAPDSALLSRLATPPASIVPPSVYEADETMGGRPVGSGPYRVESVEPDDGSRVVLRRVDGARVPASVERVEIVRFAGETQLSDALDTGRVDVATARVADADIAVAPVRGLRFIGFNVRLPPFDNPALRRAVAAAVDRSTIAGPARGRAVPAYSVIPPSFPVSRPVFRIDWGDHDAAQVNEQLSRAGLGATESVAVELWYTPSHYGSGEQGVAEQVAAALQTTGRFTVALRSTSWADYKLALARGELPLFLLGWTPPAHDPGLYAGAFAGAAGAAILGSGFADARAEALLAEEARSLDPARRARIHDELQALVSREAAAVPLFWTTDAVALRQGVSGVRFGASGEIDFTRVRVAR